MDEPLFLALALVAGLCLGAIVFGGLWWTIRRGVASAVPARWFIVSFLVRVAIAVATFLLVGAGDWRRLLACLVGFIAARTYLMRIKRLPVPMPGPLGADGAP